MGCGTSGPWSIEPSNADPEYLMDIFITGLCMQGNKGGPALALSLMHQLKRYLKETAFTFAVTPDERYLPQERKWGEIFGVTVLPSLHLKDIIPPWSWVEPSPRRRAWREVLRKADLLVDLSGIAYVGPPTRSSLSSLGTFNCFREARRAGTPYLRWTQTYGPFSSWPLRFMAARDLNSQPIVFCRGEVSRREVQQLLPGKQVLSFPDVATILPFSRESGATFLREHFSLDDTSRLVTISPSSVIYSADLKKGSSAHVDATAALADYLEARGYKVLFVPHTLRVFHNDPTFCDLAVCRLVIEKMKNKNNLVVEQDLSPIVLKNIISNAHIHVGARYHSLIAALSSGVPTMALSWHHKYRELMEFYGVEEFVTGGPANAHGASIIPMFQKLENQWEDVQQKLQARQPHVEALVEENTRLFVDLIQRVCH